MQPTTRTSHKFDRRAVVAVIVAGFSLACLLVVFVFHTRAMVRYDGKFDATVESIGDGQVCVTELEKTKSRCGVLIVARPGKDVFEVGQTVIAHEVELRRSGDKSVRAFYLRPGGSE